MNEAERKAQVLALMQRMCQLGRLLDEDLDPSDMVAVAEARIVIAEMDKAQREIDALLGAPSSKQVGQFRKLSFSCVRCL
jgi:hypothetical protein